jgi:hypothetical protein
MVDWTVSLSLCHKISGHLPGTIHSFPLLLGPGCYQPAGYCHLSPV